MILIRNVPEGLMALDRPDYDFARSEREVPGSDIPAARSDPAEWRSHEEYYEVLRVAAGKPSGDSREDRSGWDAVDAAHAVRPSPEDMRVSPERTTHILDGDEKGSGGGHRHGVGKPGKTEFPAGWNDKKIVDTVVDVARRPDSASEHQHWNDRWVCSGIQDSVEVSVIVLRSGEIWTAWPEQGSPHLHCS
jgi:Bacterial EndoU nuclease